MKAVRSNSFKGAPISQFLYFEEKFSVTPETDSLAKKTLASNFETPLSLAGSREKTISSYNGRNPFLEARRKAL